MAVQDATSPASNDSTGVILHPGDPLHDEANAAFARFIAAWGDRTDVSRETVASMLGPAVHGFGTGRDEVTNTREGVLALLDREWEQIPDGFAAHVLATEIRQHGASVFVVSSELEVTLRGVEPADPIYSRYSVVFERMAAGAWLIQHVHCSVPWEIQAAGESVPVDELRARAETLRMEVAQRTKELSVANDELRLEAAVERVRAKVMAMRLADELDGVLFTLFDEYMGLGLGALRVGLTFIEKSGRLEPWIAARTETGERVLHKGAFTRDDIEEGRMAYDAWKTGSWVCLLERPEFLAFIRRIYGATFDQVLETVDAPQQYLYGAMHRYGMLHAVAPHTVDEDSFAGRALKRFATAFELAWGRYRDLAEAERATREARIEAALERVRARAMAMRESDDLQQVVSTTFNELNGLGFDVARCLIWVFDPETEDATVWMSDAEHPEIPATYRLPNHDHPTYQAVVRAWREREDAWVYDLSGETKVSWDEVLFTQTGFADLPEQVKDHMKTPERVVLSATFTSFGGLQTAGLEPLGADDLAVLQRFGRVLDLTYRRLGDLQQAEEAAREARIEAALERIRGQAMAMRASDDLLDIVVSMRSEFVALGHEADYFWHMRWMPTTYEKAMTSGDGTRIGMVMDLPRGFHGSSDMTAWEQNDEPIGVFRYDAEGAIDYVHRMVEQGDFHRVDPNAPSDDDIRQIGGITFVMARTTHGEIGYSLPGVADPPAHHTEVLVRFAGAFDLAYRRFEDLKQAEGQAREARIEAALERVRAATSAMHGSEDIGAASVVLFDQLRALGIEPLRCGVGLPQDDGTYEFWAATTDEDGESRRVIGHESIDVHPVIRRAFEGWKQGEPHQSVLLEGDDLAGYYASVFPTMPLPDWKRRMEEGGTERESFSTFPFSDGWVYIFLPSVPTADEMEVVLRFTRVYDQTYRRYKELVEAEAHARETDIELALERVRARAMAMQRTDELSETVGVLFDQLAGLGVHALNAYLVLYDLEHDAFTVRMTGKGGGDAQAETTASFGDMPQFRSARESWEGGQPIIRIHYPHERVDTWLEHFRIHNEKLPDEARLTRQDFPNGVYNTSGRHEYGSLGVTGSRPATPEEEQLIERFAREFERTYRRFRDLEAAEKAAREARIEAALERVRSRALGMRSADELEEVTHVLREEMGKLGQPELESAAIHLYHEETDEVEWWGAFQIPGNDDGLTHVGGRIPLKSVALLSQLYGHYEAGEREYTMAVSQSTPGMQEYMALVVREIPEIIEALDGQVPEQAWWNGAAFSGGAVITITYVPPTEDHLELQRRVANAFDLAYRRFVDLQVAEAETRRVLEERDRAEAALAELRATQAQLVEQEKLASLGQLTAGIAHEIKNPLNFVNNFAEVNAELADELVEAVSKGDTDEAAVLLADLRENAAQIAKHGKRADSIVRAMMQHARGGASEMESIGVNEFLDEYAALAWHGMRARDDSFHAEVVRDFADDTGTVDVLPQELGRVVLNLLNNAFDALRETEGARVTLASRRTAQGVEITVSDNGPGIPEAIREKIFEPFFTTKPTGEGTGLGLSLSYDIITKGHGGTMTVGAGTDGGAEFRIQLPN